MLRRLLPLAETESFVREAAAAGWPRVRIVYGKGRHSPGGVGALRQAVPAWLEQHGAPWVERFERQLDADGNDGAMLVWLRPLSASPAPPRARQ
jgi:DNA-nicking Smr family endonuclease